MGRSRATRGFYDVIQVESITPAQTTTFDEAREQIQQTLVAACQQSSRSRSRRISRAKWTARTACADDYRIDRCSNADSPPDPCTEEVAETRGCDAPVVSTSPIAPGKPAFGAPAPTGLPQGPIRPGAADAPGWGPAGPGPGCAFRAPSRRAPRLQVPSRRAPRPRVRHRARAAARRAAGLSRSARCRRAARRTGA